MKILTGLEFYIVKIVDIASMCKLLMGFVPDVLKLLFNIKIMLLCLLNFRKWQLMRAYNKVGAQAWRDNDFELFERMIKKANFVFIEIITCKQ